MTTKKRMALQITKSANALSGDMENSGEVICIRKQAVKIKNPTEEINPDKNELKGNWPTISR